MLNRAKKLKLDEDEVEKTNLTKILPSEVIEKIISFVPSKLNCFLVSKDFQREAINTTRNKCILNLSPTNLLSEGLINTQWAFNEICLAPEIFRIPQGRIRCPNRSLEMCHQVIGIFNKFGSQVKKFSIFNMNIHESDLLHLLTLMPNLVELYVLDCHPADKFFNRAISSNDIIELGKLEKLTFSKTCSFLKKISCPAIQDCVCQFNEHSSSVQEFYQRHTQIKKIELKDFSIYKISLEHHQLSNLSLTHRPTSNDEMIKTIESQQNLKLLSLSQTVTDKSLEKIVKLQYLESLDIFIQTNELISKPLIEDMMQMRRLKILKIRTNNSDFITTMLEVKNVRLEELSLDQVFSQLTSPRYKLGDVAENFPNLQKLTLSFFEICRNEFKKLLQLKKLRFMNLCKVYVDEIASFSDTNISIRELTINFERYEEAIMLLKLMPNIERLNIEGYYQSAEYQKIIKTVLNLKGLQQLTSQLLFFKNKKVIKSIMEHQENTKLERIIIPGMLDSVGVDVCTKYKARFPVIHIDHKRNACLTMSRM